MREPPVFGPNGAVMNSPHMTDEMRAKIERPVRMSDWLGMVEQALRLLWAFFALGIAYVVGFYNGRDEPLPGILSIAVPLTMPFWWGGMILIRRMRERRR